VVVYVVLNSLCVAVISIEHGVAAEWACQLSLSSGWEHPHLQLRVGSSHYCNLQVFEKVWAADKNWARARGIITACGVHVMLRQHAYGTR
jgi:hypothetical protein